MDTMRTCAKSFYKSVHQLFLPWAVITFILYSSSQLPICGSQTHVGSSVYDRNSSHAFSLTSFGAKGNARANDTEAFLAVWAAACSVDSATIIVPYGFQFLIGPITLQGPCKPGMVLQIDGTIVAPGGLSAWPKQGLPQWINLRNLQGFTVQGSGVIDGQGSAWWSETLDQQASEGSSNNLKVKPKAVSFYSSNNITVMGILIKNSPWFHLTFDTCIGVKVSDLTIQSPGDSPNTDGIHLQNSQNVEVMHSSLSCGDDCISIQTGCSNVHINNVRCGPGHGISIGGLGKDGSVACVSNILVQNSTIEGTPYGVRIKTWQGGLGSVKSVSFSNIHVTDVNYPIAIDQFYCDERACSNKTDAVAILDTRYDQITGTFLRKPVYMACSSTVPCTNISMADISLAPSTEAVGPNQAAFCSNSFGAAQPPLVPSSIAQCMRTGNPSSKLRRSHTLC